MLRVRIVIRVMCWRNCLLTIGRCHVTLLSTMTGVCGVWRRDTREKSVGRRRLGMIETRAGMNTDGDDEMGA